MLNRHSASGNTTTGFLGYGWWFVRGLAHVLGTLVVLLTGGCGGDPYFSSYTHTKPAAADLVGTWRIDVGESSVPFAFGPEIQKVRLILLADGSFDAVGLPRQAFDGTAGNGDVTGKGKWTIKKYIQGWWDVDLEWPVRSDTHIQHYETLYIRNQSPEYLLHMTVSDPDLGYAVVFRREENEKK
jgi:hypothetical protein